jgi:FkbM family methyltransferase
MRKFFVAGLLSFHRKPAPLLALSAGWLVLLVTLVVQYLQAPMRLQAVFAACAEGASRSQTGRRFARAVDAIEGGPLGEADASLFVSRLAGAERFLSCEHGPSSTRAAASKGHRGKALLLVDIGANVGTTSKSFLDMCRDVSATCSVLAFEPMLHTHSKLERRGASEGWASRGWRLQRKALSDPASVGVRPFFSSGEAGDEQASLGAAASYSNNSEAVTVTTVDGVMAERAASSDATEAKFEPFLLKIDAEGFDASVLLGAAATINAKTFRFVLFEYNRKWMLSETSATLVHTVRNMEAAGYDCFLMTPEALLPLWGSFWVPELEFWRFSNVVCTRRTEAECTRSLAMAFSTRATYSGGPLAADVERCLL